MVHPPSGDGDGNNGAGQRAFVGRRRIDGGGGDDEGEEEEDLDPSLVDANAAGFLHVTHVDLVRGCLGGVSVRVMWCCDVPHS